jgi:tripartite-type tricarboxylate transporter receptor subunit TctC
MKPIRIALLALAAVASLAPATGAGQAFPTKPVRLLVPYAPGGAVDNFARPIGPKLGELLGQPVIIENRPGGNTSIAADLVAKAPPDGYTIVLTSVNHYLLPMFTKNLPYDAMRDFTPIVIVATFPNMVAVHPSLPVQSVAELIDYAKKNPGKVFYGSTGIGSTHHLAGVLLAQAAQIQIEHVPYKGGNPTIQDVLAGQIPMAILTATTIMPHAKQGKLRPLAITEAKRYAGAPDLPTLTETVPGYLLPNSWLCVLGPANLPRPIVTRLNADIRKAITSPEVRARLESVGFEVLGDTPEEFEATIRTDVEIFRRIVTTAGIKPE